MSQYVNVGGPWEKPDEGIKAEYWGQVLDIDDQHAQSAAAAGAHLLPKAEFDKLAFTPDELKLTNPRLQASASPEWREKYQRAIDAARTYRESLLAPVEDSTKPTKGKK